MEELTEALDSNVDVDIIYIDFKKSLTIFDKVQHKRLLKNFGDMASKGKYSAV